MKSTSFASPKKKDNKKGFPTTPRSAEKKKSSMLHKLMGLLDMNLKHAQLNQDLGEQNKQLLDSAVVAEVKNHS